MSDRIHRLAFMILVPALCVAALFAMHPKGLYHRISALLLTTTSMEAATHGGAAAEGSQLP